MNLYTLTRPYCAIINPLTSVTLLRSTGYTIEDDGSRLPAYDAPIVQLAQVQELTQADLQHLEGLNLQNARYAVYLTGEAAGAIRRANSGGDLLEFNGATWLVVQVLEQWGGSPIGTGPEQWVKVAVALQMD